MCNGFSTRVSRGGAIAVLRPLENQGPINYHVTLDEEAPASKDRCADRISLLVDTDNNSNSTKNQHDASAQAALKNCWLQIHRDGDLVPSGSRETIPALHKFPMGTLVWRTKSRAAASAPRTISLTVGDEGVIGRRMSIVDGHDGTRVAEGVIGWN